MAARAYKHEEVAKTPRGYRVRSVQRGTHVVRVAFPPGPRRKGAGKVVEILHPKSETNPSCIVSNQVRSNPGELIIFGNPGEVRVLVQLYRLGKERVAIKARKVKDSEWVAEANVRGEKIQSPKQSSSANAFYYVENEIHRKFGPLSNPSKLERQRGARERAARIRKARLNPTYIYFTLNGREYRTDGQTVEGKDGQTWNRTGSLPVVLAARKEWAARAKNPKAQLTPAENRAWVKAFQFHLDTGKSDAVADRLAWRDVVKEFPRLKKFSGAKANPRRRRKDRRNPADETRAAVRLFEKFHGRDPKEITEKHVSAAVRQDYTALGDLEHLKVITPLGQTLQFNFEGDGVKLASSPDGKQLYCIGGNQNLSGCLDKESLEKDFIDLGECVQVQYLARKVHANFEPVSYYHKFGENTGVRPQLAYDKLKKQIFFVGGEYFIDTKQGVSPGIEN